MSDPTSRSRALRVRFVALAAGLTLCLLAAAAIASSELRAAFFSPGEVSSADATPHLGITYAPLSHELAARYEVDSGVGVLVTDVESGSPARAVGLRTGDILLSVDGAPLTRVSSLVELLLGKRPGDRVVLRLIRDGKAVTVELTLGTWDQR